ncbi:MAG: ABC transporter ATP-binding protein [Armatimonadetes bacterium]|nr:ABC transporter ATP-binding protein [Armatimonadota bacterium]
MKALSIQQLTKTYSNGVEALKGVDLEVEEGDFFALLGPNGAGKSTLIGIITGLVTKTSGTVEICGCDLDREAARAKSCLGVVPQEFNFNMFESVLNTVVYQAGYYGIPRHVALPRAEKYLEELDLWEKRNQPAMNLSGGMKRRLMLARALINEPRMLILDEPTAGLDIEFRRSLWEFLAQRNRQGTTIILTTHYLEEAEQLCRDVAIIHRGQLLVREPMVEVLKRLDRNSFILDLKDPAPAELPVLTGVIAERLDDHRIEIDVPRDAVLTEIFQQLAGVGILVTSMRNKRNRLEELFVRLVGQAP